MSSCLLSSTRVRPFGWSKISVFASLEDLKPSPTVLPLEAEGLGVAGIQLDPESCQKQCRTKRGLLGGFSIGLHSFDS